MRDSTIWYLAHPVGGDVDANIKRALRWLAWLRKKQSEHCITAPWIAAIIAGEDDNDPAQRERGLLDAETIAGVCDGIVLVGGRVSSGMQRELDVVARNGGSVIDLTKLGDEPPTDECLAQVFSQARHDFPLSSFDDLFELGAAMWEAA